MVKDKYKVEKKKEQLLAALSELEYAPPPDARDWIIKYLDGYIADPQITYKIEKLMERL